MSDVATNIARGLKTNNGRQKILEFDGDEKAGIVDRA